MSTVAVIQFPGSNCEYETLDALSMAGIKSRLVPWNADITNLEEYSGYVLPGGFSFQDRVRAGVMSSVLPIMNEIKKQADLGKPVLGICNGCQILAESGILPRLNNHDAVQMALAPNVIDEEYLGFVCDWVYVKVEFPKHSLFTRYFDSNDVLPIPINHGEGNFKFKDVNAISKASLTKFVYCSDKGESISNYPINPNGSDLNIAGISNEAGNVMAIMPHPERAVKWHHIPRYLNHDLSKSRREGSLDFGPWMILFLSFSDYLKGKQHD